MCVLVSRCFELHYVTGLGRIQQAVQCLQSLALLVHVVVPVIVTRLDPGHTMRLKPSTCVTVDAGGGQHGFNS